MKYKVGMYGGSFDPVHKGHLAIIFEAACVCEELYIVLSYCRKRDCVPMEYRYRWLQALTRHLPNVKLLLLEDEEVSKEAYDDNDAWAEGARRIKAMIGKHIDVVFCGDDYKEHELFQKQYPDSLFIFKPRGFVPVSSTAIRENPFAYWEYLPEVTHAYFVKKVLIVGGESTGKSTLTRTLALLYNTNYIEEAGRDVCFDAGGEDFMVAEDLHKCLIYQKAAELKAVEHSNKLLFVDTDALTTKFYCQFLLKNEDERARCEGLADAVAAIRNYDYVIFLEPSVKFVQDGTRNEEILADRLKYSNWLKGLFMETGVELDCYAGDYEERFTAIRKRIEEKYGIKGGQNS